MTDERNNLRADIGIGWHENAIWMVVGGEIEIYVPVGHYPSNTFFGSSQAHGKVYEKRTAVEGDLIVCGPHYTWHVHDADVWQAKITVSEKHPFEKVYLPPRIVWPLDRLKHVRNEPTGQLDNYGQRHDDDEKFEATWVYANATCFGHNIDYWIEDRRVPA